MSFAIIADLFKSLGLTGRVFRIGLILAASAYFMLPSETLDIQLVEAIRLRSILQWFTVGFSIVVIVDFFEITRVWILGKLQARKEARDVVLSHVSSRIWYVHRDLTAADEFRHAGIRRRGPIVKRAGTKLWADTNALYLAMRQLGFVTPNLPLGPDTFATESHLDYLEAVMPLVRSSRMSDAKDLAKTVCERIENKRLEVD
jgi:hypothetical protein